MDRLFKFNKACQETTGYSFEEVSGKKVWDLFIPSEEIKGIKEIFNNIKAGMFPNAHENCWLTKDGNKRLISWSNTALSDDEGQVEHVIATGIDITERKEAEEKLKLYKEIFMNTSDGITIINPNGKIIDRNPAHREYSGLTDEELYGKTPGEFMCGDSLKSVDAGSSRVNKIVKRLRSFARLDEAELKKVDIHKGIEDTLALIHHEIKHKAEIIKTFGDIPAIACFPGQLNQVFFNLLVNSTQAIKDKGEITITTVQINGKIKITFEDTGAGISPENLRRIFDP